MSEEVERDFLVQIAEDWENDFPKLVFADWLDERGDPRGVVIRLGCELAKATAGDPDRQQQRRECNRWRGPAMELWLERFGSSDRVNFTLELDRGLPAKANLRVEYYLHEADKLHRTLPTLNQISMRTPSDFFADRYNRKTYNRLFKAIVPERLWGLDIDAPALDFRKFAGCDALRSLRSLGLHGPIGKTELGLLLNSPATREITEWDLSRARIGNDGLRLLAEWERSDVSLTGLDVSACEVWDHAAIHYFVHSPIAATLQKLRFGRNEIGDGGAIVFAECSNLSKLRELSLPHCGLTDRAARVFAEGTLLRELQFLNLRGNAIEPPLRTKLRERYWT